MENTKYFAYTVDVGVCDENQKMCKFISGISIRCTRNIHYQIIQCSHHAAQSKEITIYRMFQIKFPNLLYIEIRIIFNVLNNLN